MQEKTIQIILNLKNEEEIYQFYKFQKDFKGNLFVSVPTKIEKWRKGNE